MRDILCSSWWLATLVLAGVAGCFTDGGGPMSGAGSTTGEPTTGEATTTSTTGDLTPTTCGEGCVDAVCGDGVAMAPEECDDGDNDNTDMCTIKCRLPACGDGYVQAGESCDAGVANSDMGACTLGCQKAECGDGLVQLGVEGCDDGNAMVGDGCGPDCVPEGCGDGVVVMGEACDDGNLNDADDCKNNCTPAECGDGVVAVDGAVKELCDDGNTDETDACTSLCEPPACGDGFLQMGEQCDDGDLMEGDACDAMCVRLAYQVFVTSQEYPATFGGIEGADALCAERAQAAGLPGVYLAWISDSVTDATDRLFHSMLPYVRVGGGTVAIDWSDLTNGNVVMPIDRDETGDQIAVMNGCEAGMMVWTGTESDGSADPDHCNNWTVFSPMDQAQVGSPAVTGNSWTAACDVPCAITARLYCFEQPGG